MDSLPQPLCVPGSQRQGHDLLRTGSSAPGVWLHRSQTSEPVRTGTPLAASLLCQDVSPIAVECRSLALLGGSCPAQHLQLSSCPRPSPSQPTSWEGWPWCQE